MGLAMGHPNNGTKCVFCKKWTGDANLTFKSKIAGYQYTAGVYGKCMYGGGNQPSTGGANCRNYEPSYEASRLL